MNSLTKDWLMRNSIRSSSLFVAIVFSAACFSILPFVAHADDAKAPAKIEKMESRRHYLRRDSATDAHLARRPVAGVGEIHRRQRKDARVSNLFLSSLTVPDKTIALTRGADNNGQPKWSPERPVDCIHQQSREAWRKTRHRTGANLADQSKWRRTVVVDGAGARTAAH